MQFTWFGRSVAMVGLTLALAGCGGSPLLGTWRYDVRAALPPAVQMFLTEATFDYVVNGDGTLAVDIRAVATNTHPTQASCVTTARATGMTWNSMTAGTVNTLTIGGTPTGTQSRTGCMDPAMNQATMPLDTTMAPIVGAYNWTITGNMLTLTPTAGASQSLTLTRR